MLLLLLLLQLALLHLFHHLLRRADRTIRAETWLEIVLHLGLLLARLRLGQLRLFFWRRLVLGDILVRILLRLALNLIHSILSHTAGSRPAWGKHDLAGSALA